MKLRLKQRPLNSVRLSQRMKRTVIAGFSICFIIGLTVYFQFTNLQFSRASGLTGQFRSVMSGPWSTLTTWEYNGGTGWIPATAAPTNGAGAITICNGHNVTVTVNLSTDETIIDAGGTLSISTGKTVTVTDNTGDDLIVNGTLMLNGILKPNGTTVVVSGTINLLSGGSTNGESITKKILKLRFENLSTG